MEKATGIVCSLWQRICIYPYSAVEYVPLNHDSGQGDERCDGHSDSNEDEEVAIRCCARDASFPVPQPNTNTTTSPKGNDDAACADDQSGFDVFGEHANVELHANDEHEEEQASRCNSLQNRQTAFWKDPF